MRGTLVFNSFAHWVVRQWKFYCIIKINNNPFGIQLITRQVSSMIHPAKPKVQPVMNIVLAWSLFCFTSFWKVGTDVLSLLLNQSGLTVFRVFNLYFNPLSFFPSNHDINWKMFDLISHKTEMKQLYAKNIEHWYKKLTTICSDFSLVDKKVVQELFLQSIIRFSHSFHMSIHLKISNC